ncbi:hypothetical protein GCM10022395_15460 [Snuella lapsa]|uniref:Oligosaccharide repeat unit polymerase n=2 Tax=Snuella lapsa TaxID=870481 RepID=A0ABP6XEM3_9FLAO
MCTFKFVYDVGGFIIFMKDVENVRIRAREGKGLISQLALNFFTFGLLTILMAKISKMIKFLLTLMVFFFVLSFGNRGPALFLVVFIIYIIQAVNRKQFSFKKIAIAAVALFSLMVFFGALRTNYEADLSKLFKARFAWRPFVNIQNFQYVIDFFPKKYDFLLGKTYLVDFSMLLPGSHPNSGTFLKELMGFSFDGGSITPSYLGISYVNFGVYGLVFSPLLLGFLSNLFYEVYLSKFDLKIPSNLILLILISFNFGAVVTSGVMTVLIQNMTVIFLVYFLYIGLVKLLYALK